MFLFLNEKARKSYFDPNKEDSKQLFKGEASLVPLGGLGFAPLFICTVEARSGGQ